MWALMAFWAKQDDCTCITFHLCHLLLTSLIVALWFNRWEVARCWDMNNVHDMADHGKWYSINDQARYLSGRGNRNDGLRKRLLMPGWKWNAPAAFEWIQEEVILLQQRADVLRFTGHLGDFLGRCICAFPSPFFPIAGITEMCWSLLKI